METCNTIHGNITDIERGIIFHQVNCQGKMGAGIAKVISDKWPTVKSSYKLTCHGQRPIDLLGRAEIVEINPELYVINVFGQLNFGRVRGVQYTDYDAVLNALISATTWIFDTGRDHLPIYYPKMGCSLGGAQWEIVKTIVDDCFEGLYHTLVINEEIK